MTSTHRTSSLRRAPRLSGVAFAVLLGGLPCLLGTSLSAQHAESAAQALAERDFDRATAILEVAVDDARATAADHLLLVRVHLLDRDLAAALAAANRARLLHPEASAAAVALAEVAFRNGELERAEALLLEALELEETPARAHWNLGRVLESDRRMVSAREHYARAFDMDPDDPEIALSAARIVEDPALSIELSRLYAREATFAEDSLRRAAARQARLLEVLAGRGRCEVELDAEGAELPLRIAFPEPSKPQHQIVLHVNGSKPIRALLDTGSPGFLVLSRRAARRARLEPLTQGVLFAVGVDEEVPVEMALASRVELGSATYSDCVVRVVGSLPGDADALLGLQAFSTARLTVDYPAKKVRIRPLPGLAGAWSHERDDSVPEGWVRARVLGASLLVPVEMEGSSETIGLKLDTGAERTLIAEEVARRDGRLRDTGQRVRGLAGEQTVYETKALAFHLGGERYSVRRGWAMDLEPLDWIVGVRSGGVLGYDILVERVLDIDYRNGLVRIAGPDR